VFKKTKLPTFGSMVNEVNREVVDLRGEVVERVDHRLLLSPVVALLPVLNELCQSEGQ